MASPCGRPRHLSRPPGAPNAVDLRTAGVHPAGKDGGTPDDERKWPGAAGRAWLVSEPFNLTGGESVTGFVFRVPSVSANVFVGHLMLFGQCVQLFP